MMRSRHQSAEAFRCGVCQQWKTADGQEWYDRHDRCIRRWAGDVFAACCGHGARSVAGHDMGPGYVYTARGTIRFPGDVHPLLVRAGLARYLRTGAVPGFARQDNPQDWPATPLALGCRFVTGLDRRYRRWRKRRTNQDCGKGKAG